MATISLCMIVKNEEDVLERCLTSVADLVDEIIIIDTGSTDATKEIAEKFTTQIFDFIWVNDFSAARNASFSHAKMEYCMWLDADDVMLEEDRKAFVTLKDSLDKSIQVVMMKYHTAFDEQGNPSFSYYRERLIENHSGMEWGGAIHEAIQTVGNVVYSDCAITHKKEHPADPDRNLRIFEGLLLQGQKLEPRMQFYYGRELYYHKRYEDAVIVFKNFLDNKQGWIENNIDACCHLAYCQYQLGKEDDALQSLLRSLTYDRPRAEVCCEIARHFFDRDYYNLAVYWYEIALTCKRDDRRGGFVSPDCYGYLPCIQLCVCFSRLGDLKKAEAFHELSAKLKPYEQAVRINQNYFDRLHEKNEI